MKKILLLFTFFISCLIFSQEISEHKVDFTEELAQFPNGGVEKFRHLIETNFREKKVIGKGKEFCELKFVIERDGLISNVTASGTNESFNKEALRAISKIKTKWIPAKINEQPVRYRFRIPLNLDFN